MVKNGLVLGLFAVATVGLVALVQQGTAERIEQSMQQAQTRALGEILPVGSYDNNLLQDSVPVHHPLLGYRHPQPAYIARKNGEPSAVILHVTAPDGYSGAIQLLVGIEVDGELAGVRVLSHRETPGLGDKIELAKSPWIRQFEGKSLNNPQESGWAVKKDRGEFDQFAGATITPRAVVNAVHNALLYFDKNRAELLSAPTVPAPAESLDRDSKPAEVSTHSRAGEAATRDELQVTEPMQTDTEQGATP